MAADSAQINVLPIPEIQPEPFDILEASNVNEEIDSVESTTFYESSSQLNLWKLSPVKQDSEATQYSQAEYPLTDLSPEERQALDWRS